MMSHLHRYFRLILCGIAVAVSLFSVGNTGRANDAAGGNSQAKISTMPGVRISVPPRCPAAGPITVQVTMIADMATYYATNGNVDKAMEVFLVRRDAPGIRQLAKMDPHAIMEPETPLPPPPPGKKSTGFIKEERILDVLSYGARHEGGADYYVVGILAGRTSDPQLLVIEDDSRRLPPMPVRDAQRVGSDTCKSITPPSHRGIIARARPEGPVPGIEGAFRVPVQGSRHDLQKEKDRPFATIIAARIDPRGGVSSGSFRVPARQEGRYWTGKFLVPLSDLVPRPIQGHYRILVFSGDEVASPIEMEIPTLR